MKVHLNLRDLLPMVDIIQGIMHRKLPKKSQARIYSKTESTEITGDRYLLIGVDGSVKMRMSIDCNIEIHGGLNIPIKIFYIVLRNLIVQPMTIEYKDYQLHIISGMTMIRLLASAENPLPSFPSMKIGEYVELPSLFLMDMIGKTIITAGEGENKFNLTGVKIIKEGNYLSFIATDGHRLSLITKRLKFKSFFLNESIVIPKRGLLELTRFIRYYGEINVKIFVGPEIVIFKFVNNTIAVRKVIGGYPEYSQVIPTNYVQLLIVTKENMLGALRRVSAITSSKYQYLTIEIRDNKLRVSCFNEKYGIVEEFVNVKFNGALKRVEFNANYIVSGVASIDEEIIAIKIIDIQSPISISGLKNNNHIHLIMPVKL